MLVLYPFILHWNSAWVFFLAFDFCRFCMVIRFSSPPQRPMTSDFKGFLSQILSITFFNYLNSWERACISLFSFWVQNKGTTGTIFITSLVWRGPWLVIEPGTSRTRCQDSTTRLSRRRSVHGVMLWVLLLSVFTSWHSSSHSQKYLFLFVIYFNERMENCLYGLKCTG